MWIALVFSLLLNANAWPADIKAAREAFLNDGRQAAISILLKVIDNLEEYEKDAEINEGEKLATRFKTDEAQREFELAESLYFSAKSGSLEKYKDALKIEPANIGIMYAIIRYHLKSGSCSAAQFQLKKAQQAWKYANLKHYFNLRISECNGQSINLEIVNDLKRRNPKLGIHAELLRVQALVEKGRGKEALSSGLELVERDKSFSETYYWLFKAGELDQGGDLSYLRRYLKICQSYGPKERRSYQLEPLLCGRVKEVRAMVSKLESGGV